MDKEFKSYEVKGKYLVYHMPQEVDHHVAQQLCVEVDRLVETFAISELVLDFTLTEFMDSSGIGVVIGRSKTMRYRDGELYVTNLGERVSTIFKAAGLNKLVQMKEV